MLTKMADFLLGLGRGSNSIFGMFGYDTRVCRVSYVYDKVSEICLWRISEKLQGGAIEAFSHAHGKRLYPLKELAILDLCMKFREDTTSLKPRKRQT